MIDFLRCLYICPGLLLAFALNPYLLTRNLFSSADLLATLSGTCLTAIALNLIVAITYHIGGIAITGHNLALLHWTLFFALLLLTQRRRIRVTLDVDPSLLWPGLIAATFALFVMPLTHLAGIDTYKWQDLATAMQVEETIPWLVHPASLLGFTPRSYSSAQPILLGSLQLLGRIGVDLGFYVFSLLSGLTAVLGAYTLGKKVLAQERSAALFTLLYVLSPVFMRYNHWATGRGLFLAVYPFFLLALLNAPRLRSLLTIPATALLLCLTHRSALVAVPLVFASLLFVPLLYGRLQRPVSYVLLIACLGLAIALSPARILPAPVGQLVGFARTDMTRFGWYFPFVILGVCLAKQNQALLRRMLPAFFLTFPLAHFWDMYGALLALPFVALLATLGLDVVTSRFARHEPVIVRTAISLCIVAALTVVTHRSLHAASPDVYRAARFLNTYDNGPYMIVADDRERTLIQGYATGCPRFNLIRSGPVRMQLRTAPALNGDLRSNVRAWIAYLRHPFTVTGVTVEWYGHSPRVYSVIFNKSDPRPQDRNPVYVHGDLFIFSGR